MSMTIDDDIEMLEYIHGDYRGCRIAVALEHAISNLHKYQKITKILNSTSYTENRTVYSYTYDEATRIKHIREVLEDGKID